MKARGLSIKLWCIAVCLCCASWASPTFAQCVTNTDCNDSIDCTLDLCEAGGVCAHYPTDAACNDSDFCNGTETCDPANGDPNTGCKPGNDPCPVTACDESTDSCFACLTDAECDDGLFCNGVESCSNNNCINGSVPCDDFKACTDDTCDEQLQTCTFTNNCDDGFSCTDAVCLSSGICVFPKRSSRCDDGVFCNGAEVCDPASGDPITGCNNVPDVDCDDGIMCTDDSCDENAGACLHAPNHTECNDNVACTLDTCTSSGCTNVPSDDGCDDGLWCNGAETCDTTQGCISGTAPSCDDGVNCTTDSCDETNDTCVHTPDNAYCDDNATCSTDVCDLTLDCQYTYDDAACDDGLWCTLAETCNPVIGAPVTGCVTGSFTCDDTKSCTDDTCDEQSQTCTHTNNCYDGIECTNDFCAFNVCVFQLIHSRCDDGIFCNGAEVCGPSTGDPITGCNSVPDVNCDDGFNCTVDSCDENAGACVNTPNHNYCDDTLYCTGVELCDPSTGDPVTGCTDGLDLTCDDGLSCTDDSCDEVADTCVNDNTCSDGIGCTVDDCTVNGCEFSANHTLCDDAIDCTLDLCSLTNDCEYFPNNAPCDLGLFCDGTDICDPNVGCVYSGNPCNLGLTCDEATDSCVNYCVVDTDCSSFAPKCCSGSCQQCCDNSDCGFNGTCTRGFCMFTPGI